MIIKILSFRVSRYTRDKFHEGSRERRIIAIHEIATPIKLARNDSVSLSLLLSRTSHPVIPNAVRDLVAGLPRFARNASGLPRHFMPRNDIA